MKNRTSPPHPGAEVPGAAAAAMVSRGGPGRRRRADGLGGHRPARRPGQGRRAAAGQRPEAVAGLQPGGRVRWRRGVIVTVVVFIAVAVVASRRARRAARRAGRCPGCPPGPPRGRPGLVGT